LRASTGTYRPDIDGLRALAVVSVVAYHNFPKTAHGGFTGVDIFFVISGFLITSHIAEGLDRESFSFADFYGRRVRRIFPALLAVLAVCLLAGSLILDPSEYRSLGLHSAAGAGFLSNFQLWSEAGYFDEGAEFKPLLHLWSLAVEEQFYICWPILLWLGARAFAGRGWWTAAILAIASFALNLYLASVDPVADFYFVFARIWELLIGAVLALVPWEAPAGGRLKQALPILGLALIVAGLEGIYNTQSFPGWRALAPTLGAALVIAGGPRAFVNARLFSGRWLVAIGRISYPLYLWHWPLIAFARIWTGGEVGPPARWALIALAVVLSQLTYVYVERPIRFGERRGRNAALAALAMAGVAAVGITAYARGGLLFPNGSLVKIVNAGDIGSPEYARAEEAASRPCFAALFPPFQHGVVGALVCRQTIEGEPPEIAFIGDSHADHLFPGVAAALPGRNIGVYFASAMPSLDGPLFASVFRAVAAEPRVKTVVLAAFWSDRVRRLPPGADFQAEMRDLIGFLGASGKTVYVIDDVPSFAFRPSRCKYSGRAGVAALCDEAIGAFDQQLSTFAPRLKAATAAVPGARFVDLGRGLCAATRCSMAADGKVLYRDGNHLNINGSMRIGARLVETTAGFSR